MRRQQLQSTISGGIARRVFLVGSAAIGLVASRGAFAQRPTLVGILTGGEASDPVAQSFVTAILDGLAEEGWTSATILPHVRFNEGRPDLSELFARELVALDVDIIVAAAPPNARAAAAATRDIPIVFFAVGDPVGSGLVESFAHPGGNATGFTKEGGLGGKYLDLLRTVYPEIRHAFMMYNPDAADTGALMETSFLEASAALGIAGEVVLIRNVEDARVAVSGMSRENGDGVIVGSDNFTFSRRRDIAEIVTARGIPTVYPFVESVNEGGLIGYSMDRVGIARSAGVLAGEILSGRNPADTPVSGPTRYILAVNLQAAAALGLTIPPSLLAIAEVVVD